MNTAALKAFAPAVRRALQEAVLRKLDVVLAAKTPDYLTTFAPQVAELRRQAAVDRAALIERVAYTWFNRFTALRYLDARGWHPFNVRVLTASDVGATQPDLLRVTREGALPEALARHTDASRIRSILTGEIPSDNPQAEVYGQLVLASCRFYHALLPNLFERLDDATELLLPDDLLTEQSVVAGFRTEISDEDCSDVEIIGWLYQFYISEKKDEVMARKSAVSTDDIPAVTQLFTPHWIVRYLVENSLGRLWLLNRPGSRLREHMPYYIEGEENASGGSPDDFLRLTKPEEIRICDPAVGSGHMLTYAFDLLTLIYEEEGYAPTEIPALILRHNLHGLEICPRAVQLAELALVFKAREKSRRFFQPEHLVQPRIIELRDVRFADNELRDYIRALGLGDLFDQPLLRLLHQFEEAKNLGSLIEPRLDERAIADVRRAIEAKELGGQLFLSETHINVLRVLEQAEALTQRYHVVVANPPYMGPYSMNAPLKAFAKEHFEDSKADTFAMFISRAISLALRGGAVGMVTMQAWMFTGSFEDFRRRLFRESLISSLVHLGPRAFDSISGEVVQTVAFVITTAAPQNRTGTYIDLTEGRSEQEKIKQLERLLREPSPRSVFRGSSASFNRLPGAPVAYWLSPAGVRAFSEGIPLGSVCVPKKGMTSSDNARFLRRWQEVSLDRIAFNCPNADAALKTARRWVPYCKGGEFRKWYGNNHYLINWEHDGREVVAFAAKLYGSASRQIQNVDSYFKPSVTWSEVGTGPAAGRNQPAGFIFDSTGPSLFGSDEARVIASTLLCTNVVNLFARALNPTLHLTVRNVAALPVPKAIDDSVRDQLSKIAADCVAVARADWDNFETSWDFCDQPMLRPGLKGATLEASWRNWEAQSTSAIRRMQELETENNRLFIAAYGLEDELRPEVPEDQITLARAEARRDISAFLSYAVGCMMGRYSPAHRGLILANAGDTLREFLEKAGKPLAELTFAPDEDGIIPVLDGEWFEDEIVARTRDFLRATFGEATLRENLRFLEDSVGKDLRKYFLNDFYKDHLQTYKKRPIYWMVQSPQKGFRVLVYLHRYTRDTLNVVLNRYLREYQSKLRSGIAQLAQSLAGDDLSARERTAARKDLDRMTKVLAECEEWERSTLLPLAQQRIELDLDDGVKVNYLKLSAVLAPIPGLAAADE